MPRYPQAVLVSCPVPWDESYAMNEELFREEVRLVLAAGFRHVFHVIHGFEGELDENHHRNSRNGWRVDGLPWEQY